MDLSVYCDNTQEGVWFRDLVPVLKKSRVHKLRNREGNPAIVNELLRYDRPDIVLMDGATPRLVLEKTSECPTGHNIGQRVGRIVRAAELGVPSMTFLPFDARKHGLYSSIVNLNPRLLDAFLRISEIHRVPVMALNWPSDDRGELVRTGPQDRALSSVLRSYIGSNFDRDCRGIRETLDFMRAERRLRVKKYPPYSKPPRSIQVVDTTLFEDLLRARLPGVALDSIMRARPETVVYMIKMNPEACRREDPYTGMQFVYDYMLCRNGPKPSDKSRNLVIEVPRVSEARWLEANPNDITQKSSLWYATANAIDLKDAFLRVIP